MLNRRIQAVLFDAAGTLLRLRSPVGETYARIAREQGVDVPAEALDAAFAGVFAAAPANVHPGEPLWRVEALERAWWRDRVLECFAQTGNAAGFDDFDAYFEVLWKHYATPDAWALAPGVRGCLAALDDAGYALAVLSNFDQRLRPLLQALDLHAGFDAITTPADAGAAKPDRMIFDVCLKRLGLPGHRAVYVGDQAAEDVEAAQEAGLHAINVAQFANFAELPALIDDLEKELS